MNSDKLADMVRDVTDSEHIDGLGMSVTYSENTGITVHYRGRLIVSEMRDIMANDDVHVSDARSDEFGDTHVKCRVSGSPEEE